MTFVLTSTGLVFRDQFNRPNGAPGANWTIESGTWVIENGALKSSTAGETVIRCDGFAPRVDQHVQFLSARDTLASYITLFYRRQGTNWYLSDVGSTSDGSDPTSMRMYRYTSGYVRIGAGWSRNLIANRVFGRINASAIGTEQRGWFNGALHASASDATPANQAAGTLAFDSFLSSGASYVKDVIVCSSRLVTISGVPAGSRIRVGDSALSAVSTGADLTVDILGSQMPCVAQVINGAGVVIDATQGVFGGDVWAYTVSTALNTTVPTRLVTGLLFADDFNRANGPVGNGWALNTIVPAGTAEVNANRLSFYGGADSTSILAPPDVTEIVSQFKYDHGVNGGEGGWNSEYSVALEDGYLFHLPAAALRLYRRAGATYPLLVDIPRPHPGGTIFHYKAQTIPGTQRMWSGPGDPNNPNQQWFDNKETSLMGVGKAGPRLGTNPTAPGTLWDDVVMYRANRVRMRGLPDGAMIAIEGKWAISAGGDAVVDLGTTFCPATLVVFDSAGVPQRAIAGVHGGDDFEWSAVPAQTLPAVAGVKVLDVNPLNFDLAVKENGLNLNFNFDSATPSIIGVNSAPFYLERTFPTTLPSIRTDLIKASGFAVDRPVQDDFTIYAAVIILGATSTGAQWFQGSALIDAELGGSGNDFGVNVRADGFLIAGTGAPDTSTTGTIFVLDGLPHIIAIKRVKATGVLQVWVDDVLDITHNGSSASLTYNPKLYFGFSGAVGRTTTDYGRILAWDVAHSDADRLAVSAKLRNLYIAAPPETPTATLTRVTSTSVRIDGSAYVGPPTHDASQWQLTRAIDPGFAAPIFTSAEDHVNLLSRTVTGVPTDSAVIGRVRYKASNGAWSEWSATSVALAAPDLGGELPTVFPFEPDATDPIEETIAYRTDIITAHNDGEQRVSLRRRPTIRLRWRVTALDDTEASRLAGFLWKTISNLWFVPWWPRARQVTLVGAPGYYTVEDAVDLRPNFSGRVLVWGSSTRYDVMTYVGAVGNVIQLGGAPTFDHLAYKIWLVPLGQGALVPAQGLMNRISAVSTAVVEFELDTTSTELETALVPVQLYKGYEVLNLHPDSQDGSSAENWTLSSERSGGDLGPFLYRPYATTPVAARPAYWVLGSRAERLAYRQWLATRRGRKVALWVATYQDDLQLAAPAAATSNWVDVVACGFADFFFGTTSRVHLALLMANRTIVPLTVTSVLLEGTTVERLILETPVPVAVPINTRVSFLVLARLTDDAVTVQHLNPALSIANASFTELPRETPS